MYFWRPWCQDGARDEFSVLSAPPRPSPPLLLTCMRCDGRRRVERERGENEKKRRVVSVKIKSPLV